MALNKVILQARIPFDLEIKNGDDEKRAFLGFSVSVRRNYKPEGEEYYPEDLLYCKAFGKTAQFINDYFKKGDHLLIEGELRRDEDYTDDDGNERKGQMYVHIIPGGVQFQNGNSDGGSSRSSSTKKTTSKSSATKSPIAKKRLNPLAKKKSII